LTIEWLEKNAEKAEPWSLWVHFTDPHTPYTPPYPYDIFFAGADSVGKRALDKQIALYDGEVRFADEQVGRIIGWLEEQNFLDNTLIVFTADHGESLGEHDYYYEHGLHAYEPSVHVPLIISAGSLIAPSSESNALVGTIDLLPTILDALAVDVPDAVQGHSFLPILLGMSDKGPENFIYMEAGYADHNMSGRVCALRRASSKYVHRLTLWAKRPRDPIAVFWSMDARLEGGLASDEFYDLTTDPAEKNNLLDDKKGVSKRELQALLDFGNSLVKREITTEGWKASEVDAKTSEALRSIGYIK
jgi:arylsulfatase A-like enzyme